MSFITILIIIVIPALTIIDIIFLIAASEMKKNRIDGVLDERLKRWEGERRKNIWK